MNHDDDDVSDKVSAFLNAWNGDWNSPTIEHFCDGTCGSSIEDCVNVMFGTLIALDLLMSSDAMTPSMDDWFTFGHHAGRTVAGVIVHAVLPQAIEEGLPAWGEMVAAPHDQLPRGGREDADAGEHRLKIAKKAWRTRCFFCGTRTGC